MRCCTSLLTVAALLVACSGVDSESDRSFESESGILQEELRIDGYEEDLVPIGDVAARRDGSVAILQGQDARVRFFTEAGVPAGGFGRRGEGPGEFSNPLRLGWHADTLWVYDGRLRRITFISPSLEVLRIVSNVAGSPTISSEDRDRLPAFTTAYPQAVASDGSLVSILFAGDQSAIGRMSADGELHDILIPLPPEEGGIVFVENGTVSTPFGNSPKYAIAPAGAAVAVAMASLEGADAGTFRLTVVNQERDTIFSDQYVFEPETIGSSTVHMGS